jgi:hypothetical protein
LQGTLKQLDLPTRELELDLQAPASEERKPELDAPDQGSGTLAAPRAAHQSVPSRFAIKVGSTLRSEPILDVPVTHRRTSPTQVSCGRLPWMPLIVPSGTTPG